MQDKIISITSKAKAKIVKLAEKESKNYLRLGVKGGGCSGLSYSLNFDEKNEKDNLINYESFQVVIDPKSTIYLKGITLDYQGGLEGKGFVFVNPNASNTCGCGESFSI